MSFDECVFRAEVIGLVLRPLLTDLIMKKSITLAVIGIGSFLVALIDSFVQESKLPDYIDIRLFSQLSVIGKSATVVMVGVIGYVVFLTVLKIFKR